MRNLPGQARFESGKMREEAGLGREDGEANAGEAGEAGDGEMEAPSGCGGSAKGERAQPQVRRSSLPHLSRHCSGLYIYIYMYMYIQLSLGVSRSRSIESDCLCLLAT